MSSNYWNNNRNNSNFKRKRVNWSQSLRSNSISKKPVRIRKSLQYILLVKKFNNEIDYKNIKLLKAFLSKYGKIRSRRKTHLPVQVQRKISKSIRKARAFGIIPFTYDVKL